MCCINHCPRPRSCYQLLRDLLPPPTPPNHRSCTKGILNDTLETPHDILTRVLPEQLHSRCAQGGGEGVAVI